MIIFLFRFVVVVLTMGSIAAYMFQECFKKWTMSEGAVKRKLKESDMIEMTELIEERYYNEEAGRILLPQAV